MFCPKCGTQLRDQALFCTKCGAQISSRPVGAVPQQTVGFAAPARTPSAAPAANAAAPRDPNAYDLTGLKLVFGGLIGVLISSALVSFLSNSMSGTTTSSLYGSTSAYGSLQSAASSGMLPIVLAGILYIACFIMLLVGLGKSKQYSEHFGQAKSMLIGLVITGIVTVVVVFVLSLGMASARTYAAITQSATVITVVTVIAMIVLVVIGLMAYKHIIFGMADIPAANGNEELAGKCRKVWTLFKASVLIAMIVYALVVLVPIGLSSGLQSGITASTISMARTALTVLGFVLLADVVLMGVVVILLLVRLYNVFSLYDRKPLPASVSAAVSPSAAEPAVVAAAPVEPAVPAAVVAAGTLAVTAGVESAPVPIAPEPVSPAQSIPEPVDAGSIGAASESVSAVEPVSASSAPAAKIRFCGYCGAKLPEGAHFCAECGAPIGR